MTYKKTDLYSNEFLEALENLLAVIHRDGGQHTDRVGLLSSIRDAIPQYYKNLEDFIADSQMAPARIEASMYLADTK